MARRDTRFAKTIRLWFRYINATVVVCGFAGVGFMLGAVYQLKQLTPAAAELGPYRPELATEIYSTEVQPDGSHKHTLLARLYEEYREQVDLRDICPELIDATIAIEDRRFYTHRGVSPRDIARAAWVNIAKGEVAQGASTITQQVVRNVWLTQRRTWGRKLKEIALALELEQKYSKDEILEMYLNEVCYGHGAFGVKTAADLYYGKQPKDLELHEAAMLAGIPRWPAGYSPYNHPDRCKSRRNQVLAWMAKEGYITEGQRRDASEVAIDEGLEPLQERGLVARHAPHFTHMVIQKLAERYGNETLYQGGLKVYTTLDLRLQRKAEEILTKKVEGLRRRGLMKKGVRGGQGALVCVEVKTGRVLAMVGGVGPYDQIQTNRAHPGPPGYGRQPGSSFKPYVWACALENGFGPKSIVSADPIKIGDWTPHNYSRSQSGPYTLRAALRDSVNLVSVRLVKKLSPHRVRRVAAKMLNIPPDRLAPYHSLALGVSNISPLEQALGFCAFANRGLRPTVRYCRRIEDHTGRVLVKFQPQCVPVIKPTTAQSMLSMLQGVVQSGTGWRARACGRPCAGKTGTTNNSTDVWFVGVTPELSAAVWLGNEKPSRMPGAYGGSWAAPVWRDFIKQACKIVDCDGQFPSGPGAVATRKTEYASSLRTITVCVETGMLADEHCPVTKEITIGPDEEPPALCTKHGAVATQSSDSRPSYDDRRTVRDAGHGPGGAGSRREGEAARPRVSPPQESEGSGTGAATVDSDVLLGGPGEGGEAGAIAEPGSIIEEEPAPMPEAGPSDGKPSGGNPDTGAQEGGGGAAARGDTDTSARSSAPSPAAEEGTPSGDEAAAG